MISSSSPHVRPMGRTCGEPDEIELTAMGVKLNGLRCRDEGQGWVRRGGGVERELLRPGWWQVANRLADTHCLALPQIAV